MATRSTLIVTVATLYLVGCRGGPYPVSLSGSGAYEASLATLDDGVAIAWHDMRDGNPEVYVRLLTPRGQPRTEEHRLTTDAERSYEPDIDVVADDLAVAWYEESETGSVQAKVGFWTQEGERQWVQTLSSPGSGGRSPVLEIGVDELFCAWIEDDDAEGSGIWGRWFDLSGQALGPPQRLADAGDTTWNLNAAADDEGRVWVTFDAKVGTVSEELFLVRVEPGRSEVARLTRDDGFASKFPDLAFGGGRLAVTWFDERDGNREVYLVVTPDDEWAEGFELRSTRVTRTPGESIGAYGAWNGRHFGLAWSDDTEGQHEVYFQAFDREGMAVNDPRRLTRNRTASLIPAIEPFAEGFALAWNEDVVEERRRHGEGGRSEIVFTIVR